MKTFELAKGSSPAEIDQYVEELIADLSLAEKTYMMSGHGFLHQYMELDAQRWGARTYQAGGGNEARGIPSLQFSDGPRGIVTEQATCFPVSMARGATWDADLEERIGDAIGKELRALGGNLYGGVCINLLRHPAWGRAQETYGEDPCHLGELGAALVRGVQKHNVIATAKHFAANSIENARFKVNVKMDERTLREIYLPHFRRCVEEGVGSIMSAYNKLNGEYCGQNSYLLNDILKKEWRFEGFVHSDWLFGVRATYAATHGLDIENPEPNYFSDKLTQAVEESFIAPYVVDDSVRRILRTLFRRLAAPDPQSYDRSLVACPDHVALAREAAEKGMVLLRNEGGMLPLAKEEIGRLAIIGELADAENTGDHGSSWARPPVVVTPLAGLRAYLADRTEVVFHEGQDLAEAQRVAAQADVVVVVVGYTYLHEGEYIPQEVAAEGNVAFEAHGGDRDSLSLLEKDVRLIRALSDVNQNIVVILNGGSAIVMEEWQDRVPAILMAWYAGMEGGNALARVLFGEVNPSGKLPCVFPRSASQLPFFDKDADEIIYDFYHGYHLFDREGSEPAFPFGFGLSYTSFAYANLRLDRTEIPPHGEVTVHVDVTNTGVRAGDEVVQLYVGYPQSAVERHAKDLKAFQRLSLQPGETQTVSLSLKAQALAYYDVERRTWVVEPSAYTVLVGPSSRVRDLLTARFQVK